MKLAVAIFLLSGICIAQHIAGFNYLGEYNNHAYYRSDSAMHWTEARDACIAAGGHLATIASAEENAFIWDHLGAQSSWIGFTDSSVEGQWEWITGEPVSYLNWSPGNPDNYGGNQDYANLWPNYIPGSWDDVANEGLTYAALEVDHICNLTEIPFIDNFDSPELDSCWTWIREDTSRWSLNERPGWMRINPYYYNNNYVNWLVRTVYDSNFLVQTKLQHTPEFGTGAGPFIYLDDLNWINVELLSGQIVRTHSMLNGAWDGTNTDFPAPWTSVYFQIEKMGNTYTASVSPDSVTWHHVKTWQRFLGSNGRIQVGMFTEAWSSSHPLVDFDYFRVDPLPGTTVCGDVSGVWDSTGSPYYVTCDVTVPAGQTLEIQPGVEVLFTGHYKFNVFGNLQAIGTEQDSIVFTRAFPTEESKWWGIRFYDSASDSSVIRYCLIEHGLAITGPAEESQGGGILIANCAPEVSHSTIRSCRAQNGGGIAIRFAQPKIQACVIEGNTADQDAGGIASDVSLARLEHCIIAGNSALWRAGGMYSGGASIDTLINCTVANNSAVQSGGGVFSGTIRILNSVLWSNLAPSAPQIDGSTIVRFSNVQGGYPYPGDNIDTDPLFVDAANGDFHLQQGSPCIDTGDPNSPLDPDSTRADMGAFYYHQAPPCPPTSLPFIDNFDSPELDSCWSWIREDTSHWSLTERPGWMRIVTQNGHFEFGDDQNILSRIRPGGDFRLETKLAISPQCCYNGGALLIHQDADNFVALVRLASSTQQVLFQGHVSNNVIVNTDVNAPDTLLYLRLDVQGTTATGYWSADGVTWSYVAQAEFPWVTSSETRISLSAEGGPPEIPADFDYFRVDSLPSCPFSKVYVPQQFPTVSEALDATCDGDTIMLAAGNYGPIDLTGKPRVIIGAGMDSTFVAGSTIVEGGSTVSQLTATGGAYTYAVVVPGGFTSRITFNWARVTGAHVGLVISNDPAPSDDSLFLDHCVFEFLGAYGVQQEDASLIVDHCVFRDIGIPSWGQQNAGIANCCRTPAGPGYDNLVVRNSVFMNHRLWAIKSNETPDYPTFLSHNCFYANGTNYMPWMQSTSSVFSDPLFVGGSPFDFHTQNNSPLIGAGDPTSPPDPDGTPADIGLYWNPTDNNTLCQPTEIPFIDEFDSPTLDSCWTWIREDTSRWSLTEREGWLRIVPAGVFYGPGGNLSNILLRSIAFGDFSITTRIEDFGPTHECGLIVYQNDDHAFMVGYQHGTPGHVRAHLEGGNDPWYGTLFRDWMPVYLRISKIGQLYSAFASTDSTNWSFVWSTEADLAINENLRVGLYGIGNPPVPNSIADFDYFRIDPLPGTTVCGNVSGLWDSTGSPYYVTCDVTVPAGQTLEIQPGVEVLFTGHYKFNVFGNLQAIGTEDDSIVFTRAFPTEESKWAGLRIVNATDTIRLDHCVVEYGNATGGWPDGYGGGLLALGSSIEIASTTIQHSSSFGGAAGARMTDCPYVRVQNSVFRFNSAGSEGAGGGLQLHGVHPNSVVNNCLFYANHSGGVGGGVEFDVPGTVSMHNCTIVRNSSVLGGAGLATSGSNAVSNCIVWENTGAQQVFSWYIDALTMTYSDIQGGYPGIGNIDADPLFVNAANGDFQLQQSSPCINSGDPTSPLDPDGSRADMGAFPFYQPPVCGTVTGVWPTNSAIKVACDLLVPDGDSLFIEPGVSVEFLGDYKLTVEGKLIAQGTASDSIRFWTDTLTNPDRWSGVRFIKSDDTSILENCIFRYGSSVTGDSAVLGGAVYVDSSIVHLTRCTFEHNQAQFGGAVNCFMPLAGSEITGCVFRGNASIPAGTTGYGGAVRVRALPLTITECLFEDNTARLGAAVNATLTTLDVVNCTFVSNNSTVGGHTGNVVQGTLSFSNCIFVSNDTDRAFDISTGSASVNYSCIDGWTGPFSNLAAPTGFGTLTATNVNSDSVDTYGNVFMDPLFGVNQNDLQWNSPAIDAGDPVFAPGADGTPADQGWKAYYQPSLTVTPDSLDFGTLFYGEDAEQFVTIFNPSSVAAPLLDLYWNDAAFDADTLPDWLAAGDTIVLSVVFTPPMEGIYNDTLRLVSRLAGPDMLQIPMIAIVPLVPGAVDSLVITRGALNGTQLYWAPVTTTTSGQPFTPTYYIIYGATSSDGPYVPFGVSTATSYNHPFIINTEPKYFYYVTASDGSAVTGVKSRLQRAEEEK